MGRSDANLLSVPKRETAQSQADAAEGDDAQEMPVAEAVETEPISTQVQLERCPHCGRALSSIDIKTNHCFQCGAMLIEATPDRPSASGDFTVRI